MTGTSGLVLGAPGADVLVVAAKGADGDLWAVVDPADEGVSVEQLTPVDQTRSIGRRFHRRGDFC